MLSNSNDEWLHDSMAEDIVGIIIAYNAQRPGFDPQYHRQVCWNVPVSSESGSWEQEDQKFKSHLATE